MRVVHWFRNDLRLEDNTALAAACALADEWVPLFVFDPRLSGGGERPGRGFVSEKRNAFLLESLAELAAALAARGCPLLLRRGDPVVEVERVLAETRADRLTFNRDYTPYARRRDQAVVAAAGRLGVRVGDCKDRVVFESHEVRTREGGAYHVYTPYMRAWRAELARSPLEDPARIRLPRPVAGLVSLPLPAPPKLELAVRGGAAQARRRLETFVSSALSAYEAQRDRPGVDGTSRLSPHLRFGTLSARDCVRAARRAASAEKRAAGGAQKWIDELIWREFYCALLAEYPRLLVGPFRREYARLQWNEDEPGFAAWCEGRTGYPIVDAGMRQLRRTGWMHNRSRMIAASFLTKDLLLDWRRGEAFFMEHLIDGDPASNNGGWQWSASTGTDAQPYFRVFHPVSQGERFDPDGAYVRRFIPELREVPDRYVHRPWDAPTPPKEYPSPIVDHAERRIAAVARYGAVRVGLKEED